VVMLRPVKNLDACAEVILVNSTPQEDLTSSRVPSIKVNYEGLEGESHSGLIRSSCERVRHQYKKGTEIRNTRQISLVSIEELTTIASTMGIPKLEPEWIGANLLVSGIPNFSKIPPSTRLIFESGASLVVDLENGPCKYPGEIIDHYHPGYGSLFPKAAYGQRGITAWVEREGQITTGDTIKLHIPPQQIYEIPS
jgi:MOSC domain-containing protein YiiM